MSADRERYTEILAELGTAVRLVAVSKTKPPEDILELYRLGQKDFGENYVQELVDKQLPLPADIRWHFIGHLQSNKVKYIAPFVHLIHGVDSIKLLKEIDKQAGRNNRVIDCLLQVHIASEETKFGFDAAELEAALAVSPAATIASPTADTWKNIRIRGLMGMASFTEDPEKVRKEFRGLKNLFDKYFPVAEAPREGDSGANPQIPQSPNLKILSMGMSADYRLAIEEGSTMVRIGSLLFGSRK